MIQAKNPQLNQVLMMWTTAGELWFKVLLKRWVSVQFKVHRSLSSRVCAVNYPLSKNLLFRARSRLDHVLTTNKNLQCLFETGPRPHPAPGSHCGIFGLHPSATAVFRSAQTNCTKGDPEFDSTGLNNPKSAHLLYYYCIISSWDDVPVSNETRSCFIW